MALQPWITGTVIRIADHTPTTRQFWIEVPALPVFDFKPGQFVTLDLPIHEKPNKRWRSYSIASWPDGEAGYFTAIESSFDREAARYDAVIFFQSAAIHGEDVRSNNPYRSEDSHSAQVLDDRLRRAWERHPNFHYIPTETSFMRKINRGLDAISGVLTQLRAGRGA